MMTKKEIQISFFLPKEKYDKLRKLGLTGKYSNYAIGNMGIDCLLKSNMGNGKKTLSGFPTWFVENSVDKIVLYDYLNSLSKNNTKPEEKYKIVRYLYQHFKSHQSFMNEMTNPKSIFHVNVVKDALGSVFTYDDIIKQKQEQIAELEHTRNAINEDMVEKNNKIKEADQQLQAKLKELEEKNAEITEKTAEVEELDDKTLKGFKKHFDRIIKIINKPFNDDSVFRQIIFTYDAINDIQVELGTVKQRLDKL